MDPNQQPQYPTTNPGGQYDFILNPTPHKRGLSLHLGGNFAMKLLFIAGGALAVVIILVVVLSLFTSGSSTAADLTNLAETQNELIHIATESSGNTVQQTTQNLAMNVLLISSSQQQSVLQALKKDGVKLSTKQLKIKESVAVDQQLTNAQSTSDYDTVFIQIIQNQLQSYESLLKQLNGQTKSTTEKSLTFTYYQQTQLLLTQIPS